MAKFYTAIIDDFLAAPEELIEFLQCEVEHGDVKNPADGVVYPNINTVIPKPVQDEIYYRLSAFFPLHVLSITTMFSRLCKADTVSPHGVHTDALMGEYTAILYLTEDIYAEGGTGIFEHASGTMPVHPKTKEQEIMWKRDHKDMSKWDLIQFCPMVFNRCLLLRSELFHKQEPEGFGEDVFDGRMVLVTFFRTIPKKDIIVA